MAASLILSGEDLEIEVDFAGGEVRFTVTIEDGDTVDYIVSLNDFETLVEFVANQRRLAALSSITEEDAFEDEEGYY